MDAGPEVRAAVASGQGYMAQELALKERLANDICGPLHGTGGTGEAVDWPDHKSRAKEPGAWAAGCRYGLLHLAGHAPKCLGCRLDVFPADLSEKP